MPAMNLEKTLRYKVARLVREYQWDSSNDEEESLSLAKKIIQEVRAHDEAQKCPQ